MEKQAVFISLHLKQESGSVQRVVLSAVLDGIIIRVTPDVQHLRILGQFIEIPPNVSRHMDQKKPALTSRQPVTSNRRYPTLYTSASFY
jgi:hypothetical protein